MNDYQYRQFYRKFDVMFFGFMFFLCIISIELIFIIFLIDRGLCK